MSWEVGNQPPRGRFNNINEEILNIKGYIEEREAKLLLYKFLRRNITFSVKMLSGVDLFPFQHMAIKSMFETDYFLGVWSRGMSKSWTTGIFAYMDAVLNQGVQIGIISKSFRQAKMIFKKIEDIANKPEAAMLAQCGLRTSKTSDQWTMKIGESEIHALPLGDGEKLRGFRFHRIIIDEFLLMPERIYNEVIIPFLSVVENPIERENLYNLETELIERGEMGEHDRYIWPNNKLIMLSSASYKFEYMYKVYEKFNEMIKKGSRDPSAAHRTIMHFSYDSAPKRLYDQNLVDQARKTMSASQFAREFNAEFTDDADGYFKPSTMLECTVPAGEEPSVEVKGDPNGKYLMAFDPSWAESESSDNFAIHLFKLNDEAKQGTLVHSYALAGAPMHQHIKYFKYLMQNFNIVSMVGDKMGGVQFISAANESSTFKDAKLKIELLEPKASLDKKAEYNDALKELKQQYNKESGKICILRNPTTEWIREANEFLQSNFDHKRIWFASRAIDDFYDNQRKQAIPIEDIKFSNIIDIERMKPAAKMIEFVEHQEDMIELTKKECAMIMPTQTSRGHQTFDLPANLRKTTGPEKARKDRYSALVLGNWMIKIYYEMIDHKVVNHRAFRPRFIK